MTAARAFLYWGKLDKRRPVLVVSTDRFNLRSDYVTVVPGSTRLRPPTPPGRPPAAAH